MNIIAETIKGINVVIGAETTGLSAALSDVNKKSKEIQSELKQVERLLKFDPSNTELLAQKHKLLGDAVANTREKLERLKAAQEQVNEQFQKGEISEGQYRAFQREIAKTEQELQRLEEQLKKSHPTLEAFGAKAKEVGEKLSTVGGNLTKYVTAPLAAAGAGLLAVGSQFDDAFDKIRTGTGATGEALEELKEDFRAVAKEVPASFEDIATAIADYNTRLGLSGEALQKLSAQTLELARITGQDLATVIENTSQSFQAFQLPTQEYGNALDFVFKVSQSTGISLQQLQQDLIKFAPALQQLGLGFQESATLIGQLEKAGVNVEQVLSGLNKAVATMAKEGVKDANEAIKLLFEQIKNAPTDIQATQVAIDTFGARAGPALATAIREGKLEYQDLLATLQGSNETILGVANDTKDWAERLAELKNNVMLALEPIGEQFFGAINDLIPLIKDVTAFIAGLIEKFANLPGPVQEAILIAGVLVAALGPVLSLVGSLITTIGTLTPMFAALSGPIGIAVAAIAGLTAAGVALYQNWDTIKARISSIWNSIKETASKVWGSIKDTIKGTINSIIGFINKWIRALNNIKIHVPSINIPLVGTVGGWTIGLPHIPEIPMLAEGGIVTKQTLAMIGEKEPEAVIPLRELRSIIADILEEQRAKIELQSRLATAGGPEVHLHIGTLVADPLGLKELERTLQRYRIGEIQRIGGQ